MPAPPVAEAPSKLERGINACFTVVRLSSGADPSPRLRAITLQKPFCGARDGGSQEDEVVAGDG